MCYSQAIDNAPENDMETTQDKIRKILSGSCTPASDLLDLVDDGAITAFEASGILRNSGRKVADVHSAAAAEIEQQRRFDC